MVAVTFGTTGVAAPATTETSAGAKGRGFFMRVFDSIAASQMARAQREVARYRHLLPPGYKFDTEQEPFGGW